MVSDNLGNEGETQPGAVFAARNEGLENIGSNFRGNPGAIVNDFDLQRQWIAATICAPQAQGDLMIIPVEPAPDAPWQELPAGGLQVIHGEATGNTHWLHRGFDGK
jgi:hypothetical protein